jgi:hypothetical protein
MARQKDRPKRDCHYRSPTLLSYLHRNDYDFKRRETEMFQRTAHDARWLQPRRPAVRGQLGEPLTTAQLNDRLCRNSNLHLGSGRQRG